MVGDLSRLCLLAEDNGRIGLIVGVVLGEGCSGRRVSSSLEEGYLNGVREKGESILTGSSGSGGRGSRSGRI